MSAIGPGDWVECVCDNRVGWTWHSLRGAQLIVGRLYQVECVGVCYSRSLGPTDGIALTEASTQFRRGDGSLGFWRLDRFRLIYR